jgi:hypothetical protein
MAPHMPRLRVRHSRPSQQPNAHDVASQMHWPFTHACPAPHGLPWPHRHSPAVQRSADCERQSVHTAPAEPHAVVLGDWHCPLKQQPDGQFVASQPVQVPPSQLEVAGQV